MNLGAIGTSAAISSTARADDGEDYRALVCVFLAGGNDCHNTLIPLDPANYDKYARLRGAIKIEQASLQATELVPSNAWTDGRRMALSPSLAPLKSLFDQGHMAMVMNVGPLLGPLTLAQYKQNIGVPAKLFSHNDQQSTWQSGGTEGMTTGWGGRMADLMLSGNGANGSMFTSISATGNSVFMSGRNVSQYQVSPSAGGAVKLLPVPSVGAAVDPAVIAAMSSQLQAPRGHLFEESHASVARRSIGTEAVLTDALAGVGDQALIAGNSLSAQLNLVARLIAARSALGVKRQVFFVSFGTFDLHAMAAEKQPILHGALASALKAFYDATVTMGVSANVTTFTASDFGRTLTNNGDGSDHGWGGYHFVMGDSVQPRSWFGQLPDVAVNGRHDVGQGRLLPAVSVDQYGATLARWMGTPASEMATVFPNIGRYESSDLGFMKST
nr:DUF1501 domain-containing protein [Chondromyces crocatus]